VILRLGATGDDVRTLQIALHAFGHYVALIDGDFGPKTETAVREFQAAHALTADGVVGAATWTALLVPARTPFPAQRCYPLRCLPDLRKPVVTSGHKARNPSRPTHYGADLMYAWRSTDPPKKIGDSGRTERWVIPENTWAIAPFVGRVVIAGPSKTGMRVWLQHPSGWNVGFFHHDQLAVDVGSALEMGEDVGRVNNNPAGGSDPDHLHFELYWGDIVEDVKHGRYPKGTVDPQLMLESGALYLPAV
jgi:hypothetical protein